MDKSTEFNPEELFRHYLICNEIMTALRAVSVACARLEDDDGLALCGEMLLQVRDLKSLFEPDTLLEENLFDE
jgi:hypothetical protein